MKPLSKKTRLLSGVFLVIIFMILAPIILANSFGYHLDKLGDVFTIVKTGGVYVMSDVSGVQIYVDDEYQKDSGLFLKNTLIQNLEPEITHKIVAQKEGRHSWIKELYVYESLVTEARILMLEEDIGVREVYPFWLEDEQGIQIGTTTPPEDLEINEDFDEDILIDGFVPTNLEYRDLVNLFSDEEENVYSTSTSLLPEENKITDSQITENATNSTSTIEKKEIPKYFIDLGVENPDLLENLIIGSDQVAWLEEGNIVLNWIDEGNTPNFYYCLDMSSCRESLVLDWQDDILRFDFLPGRNDVFVILVDSGIYAVEIDDRSQRNIQPIYLGEDLDFRKDNNETIFVKEGNLFYEILL